MSRMAWLIYNVFKTSCHWVTECCGGYNVLGGMYVYRGDCCLQSAMSGVLPIAEGARSITLFFLITGRHPFPRLPILISSIFRIIAVGSLVG